jgi:DNA-binding MarR family transcriptional regulator
MDREPDAKEEVTRSIVARWGGHDVLLEDGFVPVPRQFLAYAGRLRPNLTPAETVFVLHLMSFKWDERAPFPGYKTIAERMGVSVQYARKVGRTLEEKGLLRREIRVGQTNRFDLTPLFRRLADRVSNDKLPF